MFVNTREGERENLVALIKQYERKKTRRQGCAFLLFSMRMKQKKKKESIVLCRSREIVKYCHKG